MDEKTTAAAGPQALTVPSRATTVAHAFAGLMPSSLGEAFQLAGYLAKSQVIPSSLRGKPESVLAVVMAGMELGLTPLRALQSITIISGNMAMKTDLQLALVRRSGLLAYHDEGFEFRGKTDQTLKTRAKDADKILALVSEVPAEKPYGWCTVQRTGEDQLRTYVFSWVDADRVLATEWEEGEDGGKREKTTKKLADKHNYKNYPQSMYPRRARGAVLQVVFGDVLAGIPAVEALEGGQVFQAEFTPVVDAEPDDVDTLLAKITDADPELATGITAGFEHLGANRARQLQLLTKYKDDHQGLYAWLRDEAARRKGADSAPPKAPKVAATPAAEPKQEDEPKPAAGVPDQDTIGGQWQRTIGSQIAESQATDTWPGGQLTGLAAKFQQRPAGGGSF